MLGQHHSAQRPIPKGRERDAGLAVDFIEPERLTSRLAVRGRMASLRASTHACDMGF